VTEMLVILLVNLLLARWNYSIFAVLLCQYTALTNCSQVIMQ